MKCPWCQTELGDIFPHKSSVTHRKIAEEYIGQQISDDFDVHHLDHDHKNNDPENLVAVPHEFHVALHGTYYVILIDPIYKRIGEAKIKRREDELDYWIIFRDCLHEMTESIKNFEFA